MSILRIPSLPDWLMTYELEPPSRDGIVWEAHDGKHPRSERRKSGSLLERFSSSLLAGGYYDCRSIPLNGAVVTLPRGVEIYRAFKELVDSQYRAEGLDEFFYPTLLPLSLLESSETVFSTRNRLFKVGTDDDFENCTPVAALSPTGEAAVYTHWSKMIRLHEDLPIKMYREASYFRPRGNAVSTGSSIFRALEATGVFEFHCCFANAAQAAEPAQGLTRMLREICRELNLPVLWSIRPTWTNNASVAESTLAADLHLPLGKTVQVAALYDQAQRFSSAYGVTYAYRGRIEHTYHLAGFCSKRMVSSLLLLSLLESGRMACPPSWAPSQLGVITKKADSEQAMEIDRLRSRLAKVPFRVLDAAVTEGMRVGKAVDYCKQIGVPLSLVIDCSSPPEYRCVFTRTDTDHEARLTLADLDRIPSLVEAILADLECSWRVSTCSRARDSLHFAYHRRELGSILEMGRIAVCPLKPEETVIREIESRIPGEVLGFVRSDNEHPCLISGEQGQTMGYIARRI